MTSTIIILISLFAIVVLVGFKLYEKKSGKTVWKKMGLEWLTFVIERGAIRAINHLHKWDARNVSYYIRESFFILVEFYRALQKISSERFAAISNPEPEDHGNKAASFYLKNIKEHKDKIVATGEADSATVEENTDLPA